MNPTPKPPEQLIFVDIRQLIEASRQQVAVAVNAALTTLYWQVGKRINEDLLGHERADYGKQVVATLARQLTTHYGPGWGEKQLRQCMKFAQVFADEQIVYAVRTQLSWTYCYQTNIRIADYLTVLPSRQLLQEKLHKAIQIAHHKLNRNE